MQRSRVSPVGRSALTHSSNVFPTDTRSTACLSGTAFALSRCDAQRTRVQDTQERRVLHRCGDYLDKPLPLGAIAHKITIWETPSPVYRP